MDKIQKVLIEAGRKDLAQQYYKKIAARSFRINFDDISFIYDHVKNLTTIDKGEENTLTDEEIKKVNDSIRKMFNETKTLMHYREEMKKRVGM